MMDVVTALPPSNRQAAAEISNEHADQGIGDKVLCDGTMTSIVGSKHDLMLWKLDMMPFSGGEDIPRTNRGRRPKSCTTHT